MSAPTGFAPEIRDGILLRDAEMCAMSGHPRCRGGRATEANHRLNRGIGGDPRALVNSPANGCAVEHSCNWLLEVDAEFAEVGRARGVKLDHSGDDLDAIVRTPFWSHLYGQWLVLRVSGAYLTGDTDSGRDARDARVVGSVESGFALEWSGTVNIPAVETSGVTA